jgi:hypothetical protein
MSDPITKTCEYCGSPHVMDDAWWCDSPECWEAYNAEEIKRGEYEDRTPLTVTKAILDMERSKATVWGPPSREIESAADKIARLARLPVH